MVELFIDKVLFAIIDCEESLSVVRPDPIFKWKIAVFIINDLPVYVI